MAILTNIVVIAYSLVISIVMLGGIIDLRTYMLLLGIEYIAVLILNAGMRKAAKTFIIKKRQLISYNRSYPIIRKDNIEKDLKLCSEEEIINLSRELFKHSGYKVRDIYNTDYKGDFLLKKEKDLYVGLVVTDEIDEEESVKLIKAAKRSKDNYSAKGIVVVSTFPLAKFEDEDVVIMELRRMVADEFARVQDNSNKNKLLEMLSSFKLRKTT